MLRAWFLVLIGFLSSNVWQFLPTKSLGSFSAPGLICNCDWMLIVARPVMRFCWMSGVWNALNSILGFKTPQVHHYYKSKGLKTNKPMIVFHRWFIVIYRHTIDWLLSTDKKSGGFFEKKKSCSIVWWFPGRKKENILQSSHPINKAIGFLACCFYFHLGW